MGAASAEAAGAVGIRPSASCSHRRAVRSMSSVAGHASAAEAPAFAAEVAATPLDEATSGGADTRETLPLMPLDAACRNRRDVGVFSDAPAVLLQPPSCDASVSEQLLGPASASAAAGGGRPWLVSVAPPSAAQLRSATGGVALLCKLTPTLLLSRMVEGVATPRSTTLLASLLLGSSAAEGAAAAALEADDFLPRPEHGQDPYVRRAKLSARAYLHTWHRTRWHLSAS